MNTMKTTLLMAFMMILFIVVGSLLGGQTGMMIAFIFALALNFGSYWFSDKIVLSMYKARKVSREDAPKLYNTVENLASNALLPMPKVYIIENPTPNAFATGRNPQNGAVAVTTGILKMLSQDELEGVIAHELSHIKNRDILVSTIAATLVGTITLIARMAGWAAMFGGRDEKDGNIFADLALMILAPLVAVLIQLAISRSREYGADSGGAEISGKPLALASALAKLSAGNAQIPMRNAETATAHMFIVNPLSGKALARLFSTHPSSEERIKRLQEIAGGRR
ncbi:MAG: protease HtpX [Ignavibacteriae bacterium HGW-Ignavibacteriae-2]|jgi:heat shock protein HtpX|nr:zinc metalloprotease HtpX [Bacteroidota bacterium]PKL90028.1 MAG: protease HtpX [Ignavibacteriae bacterium HGW-Ignavibacteriae-2]